MSMAVDRTGVFRVKSTEHGLGQTRKVGYPQYNVNAKLTAYYDEETEQWVDWSEFGQEVDIRLCLFGQVGKKKEVGTTLTYDQVCKVFNWDGADLQVLAEIEAGVEFQVTIKDNDPEYVDKTPFQVSWIDVFDADPTQKVAKCTPEEIKGLNAKYAALLKAKATPKAPAKAGKKKAGKPETDESKPDLPSPKKPEPGVITKKTPPKAPPKVPSGNIPTKQVDQYTKTKAWQTVVDLKGNIDDDQLGIAWQTAITEVSNGGGEDILDGEGWWKVKDRTLDAVGGI